MNVKEFKPTILFLAKFTAIYLIGNFLYGIYVTACLPDADPVTRFITWQCSELLGLFGWDTGTFKNPAGPTAMLKYDGKYILSVYEGCNGVNVMIVFLAFVIGFGPSNKKLITFLPVGIMAIHFFNLLRLMLLFWVVLYFPGYWYFTHKYLFTAFIYLVVFSLWVVWIRKNFQKK